MTCEGIIKLACLSWYKDEDDCIVILNQNMEEVMLNPTLSKIWEAADDYKYVSKCYDALTKEVPVEKIESCFEYLQENELIKIFDTSKLFDSIFS